MISRSEATTRQRTASFYRKYAFAIWIVCLKYNRFFAAFFHEVSFFRGKKWYWDRITRSVFNATRSKSIKVQISYEFSFPFDSFNGFEVKDRFTFYVPLKVIHSRVILIFMQSIARWKRYSLQLGFQFNDIWAITFAEIHWYISFWNYIFTMDAVVGLGWIAMALN